MTVGSFILYFILLTQMWHVNCFFFKPARGREVAEVRSQTKPVQHFDAFVLKLANNAKKPKKTPNKITKACGTLGLSFLHASLASLLLIKPHRLSLCNLIRQKIRFSVAFSSNYYTVTFTKMSYL